MTLTNILAFSFISPFVGFLARGRWRNWTLLIISVLAIYWLQPSTSIRHLDFWFPTVSIALAIIVWAATLTTEEDSSAHKFRGDIITGVVISGIILGIGLTRYIDPICCLTPTRPPQITQILLVLISVAVSTTLIIKFHLNTTQVMNGLVLIILILFIVLKTDPLAESVSAILRRLMGQSTELASAADLRWLGFSYVAFRLIHTLRDRVAGRLPDLTLQEYIIYIIFYPAYTAGPIDRVQRFTKELRQPFTLSAIDAKDGGYRLIIGIFRKFVVADSLALIAHNSINATQTTSTGWLWVMLYAYSFRIYFDFSGYTDIALGLGRFLGIHLPENFDRPYFKHNLTTFWNSWHITLAQWFRAYYFNPLTRAMRTSSKNISMTHIIFLGQVSTMVLIGLWHGVTWNFAVWGLWHGIGLFINNRISERTRPYLVELDKRPRLRRLSDGLGTLLTFNYVTLGWVWFALPSIQMSWNTILNLFGLGS
jgi:D-alanyl-lipoteichoic acid acyltransferase DltB (MBOAT superfamily)